MFSNRLIAVLASAGICGGLIAVAPAAQAGTQWSGPQEVSSKFGRGVVVSDGGRVAAWIRTNKTNDSSLGPVRTAWYKSAKKGWTPSAPIPGASESSSVQLSANGNSALIDVPGTGYLMAQRSTGNTWGTAGTVVSGANLGNGVMAGSASVVFFIDWGVDDYPTPSGKLYLTTRQTDGTWSAPALVGYANPDGRYSYYATLAASKDGSTVVWLTDTFALVGIIRNDDGSWSAPQLIKQYGSDPSLDVLQLSADGTRVMWVRDDSDGILTSTRSGATWAPVSNVTVDETYSAALAPNGLVAAWANSDGEMLVSKWNGVKWPKPKLLGTVGSSPSIALTNKTLAFTSSGYRGSSLRSAIWKKGKWTSVVRHSVTGFSPAVSYDGMTLVWSATGVKEIYSVKR